MTHQQGSSHGTKKGLDDHGLGRLLSPKEIAAFTKMPLAKIYKALRAGRPAATKKGDDVRGLRSLPRVDRDWLVYEAWVYEFIGLEWPPRK